MRSKATIFLLGTVFGVAILLIKDHISFYKSNKERYFVLQRDYRIENGGLLKKGTSLKFDEGMSEGFDRFILYLNVKGGQIVIDTISPNQIVPYWLNE